MNIKQTSVNIDIDKWDILKGRGYKLQDIVDNAFNNLLDINLTDNLELNKELNNLNQKKKYLLNDVEATKNKYDNKINDLKNNIELLTTEKDNLIFDLEEEIKNIDFKIKTIEETINTNEKEAEEDKRLSEEKIAKLRERNIMFNSIYNRFIQYAQSNSNRMDFFNNDPESTEYCKKYGMSLEDLSIEVYDEQLK